MSRSDWLHCHWLAVSPFYGCDNLKKQKGLKGKKGVNAGKRKSFVAFKLQNRGRAKTCSPRGGLLFAVSLRGVNGFTLV